MRAVEKQDDRQDESLRCRKRWQSPDLSPCIVEIASTSTALSAYLGPWVLAILTVDGRPGRRHYPQNYKGRREGRKTASGPAIFLPARHIVRPTTGSCGGARGRYWRPLDAFLFDMLPLDNVWRKTVLVEKLSRPPRKL